MYSTSTSKCPFFANLSRKNLSLIFSIWAGFFFFVGWWLMIDASVVYPNIIGRKKCYYLPGIFGTVALIVVNIIPNKVVYGIYYTERKCCGRLMAKIYLFLGFVVAFGALIAASYIFVNDFLLICPAMYQWPGYALFLQNLFIFIANMMLKFGVVSEVQ